jgi:hypothetical protein
MREVRIKARKPDHRTAAVTHQAIYLGPMQQVTDDFGNVFTRGVPKTLNTHDWQMLGQSACSSAFLMLKSEAARAAASCCDRAAT